MYNGNTYWNQRWSLPCNPCSKCGLYHGRFKCRASGNACFTCNNVGHYSRVCYQNVQHNRIRRDNVPDNSVPLKRTKSTKKKERDNNRMRKFLEKRNLLRELPFSNIRNTAFLNCLHVSAGLKEELKCVKLQLKDIKIQHKQDIMELRSRLEKVYDEKQCIQKEFQELKKNEQSRCHNLQEPSAPSPETPKELISAVDVEKERLRLRVLEDTYTIDDLRKQVQSLTSMNRDLAEGLLMHSQEFFTVPVEQLRQQYFGSRYGNF